MAEYKRILHVEDDKTFQLEVDVVLKDITEIVHVDNIKDAKEKLDNESFDLILLDFTLPDGSGQALLKKIHALKNSPPVIVLSGHELTKDIPGVVKVLTKGRYKYDDFIKLIKKTITS